MSEHSVLLAVQRQVQGLIAERDAMREQIAGLVAERDALRVELEQARQTAARWRRAYAGEGEPGGVG